jgi:hypothetical protein
MEKYCTLIVALENGEFDRQRTESDCTSLGDRYTGTTSTESCKFPFSMSSSSEAKTSFSPTIIPMAFEPPAPTSPPFSLGDGNGDEQKAEDKFTRRKTAVLATDTASFLLNSKKSRLHSIVAPNSFEHQFLANSSTSAAKEEVRRMVPRQTSLAKIWDTVDSDEETDEPPTKATKTGQKDDNKESTIAPSSSAQHRKQEEENREKFELEEDDEVYRRSIALCQEVSLASTGSFSFQTPAAAPNPAIDLENEGDNDEAEDEIRALRIEEAILNQLHPHQQQRRHRKESFARYVDRMWLPTSPHSGSSISNPHPFEFDPNTLPRQKSFSVFSTDGPSGSIDTELLDHRNRTISAGGGLSHWLSRAGRSSDKSDSFHKRADADPDLEMGAFGRETAHSKEPVSYLSDCLFSQDDQPQLMVSLCHTLLCS